MSLREAFRLLISNDSAQEAERIISMLNNAGYPNRPQFVNSDEVLGKLIEEQTWDLLIGQYHSKKLQPAAALRQIKRHNRDIPAIFLTDEDDPRAVVDGLKMGARDVLTLDQDQHLLLVIERELNNRQERTARRIADRKFQESERRRQQLLDSSRDSIAYCQDGLLMYVNDSFAELFGYTSDTKDDLDCTPLIDLVADASRDEIKKVLKHYQLKGEDAGNSNLKFSAFKADGSTFTVNMEIANAIYEDEPCLQFTIHAKTAGIDSEALAAQLKEASNKDSSTGLYNRQYMQDHVAQLLQSVSKSERSAALLYIDIDHFDDLLAQHGASLLSPLTQGLAKHFAKYAGQGHTLGHFGDGVFLMTESPSSATKGLELAQQIAAELAATIIEVGEGSLQVTASIGVALLNDLTTDANAAINEAYAASEQLSENGAALYEPEDASGEGNTAVMARMIQTALDNNGFRLLFQPVISLRGSEQEHYEVVIRLKNEKGEDYTPQQFMGAAKKANLLQKLDRWVIVEATKALAAHQAKGHNTQLFLHLSEDSLKSPGLVNWLPMAFKATKLKPANLAFQFNENEVTSNIKQAAALVDALNELGCTTSLCGFGCGMKPLNILKHVKPTHIKLDSSFTQDIQKNDDPETLKNLVASLQEHQKQIIVPHVESAEVLSTLWQAGVHFIQGHYLQGPMPQMNYDFSMDE